MNAYFTNHSTIQSWATMQNCSINFKVYSSKFDIIGGIIVIGQFSFSHEILNVNYIKLQQ